MLNNAVLLSLFVFTPHHKNREKKDLSKLACHFFEQRPSRKIEEDLLLYFLSLAFGSGSFGGCVIPTVCGCVMRSGFFTTLMRVSLFFPAVAHMIFTGPGGVLQRLLHVPLQFIYTSYLIRTLSLYNIGVLIIWHCELVQWIFWVWHLGR